MIDMFKNGRDSKSLIIFIVGAIAIVALLFTYVRNRQASGTLAVYEESNVIEMDDGTDAAGAYDDIEGAIYTYDEGFSIRVPEDWERVTKSGYDTYIHPATGSSVQVQVHGYDPEINNVSASALSTEVAENGMTFLSYTRTTTSSYELMYQDYKMSTYDYVEEVYWDREHIIRLVCTLDDAYYSDMSRYYEYILNSFAWDRSAPIPEDLVLWYLETGDFEFAYPLDWTVGETDTAVYAMNGSATASMTVSLSSYTSTLDNVTGSDMTSLIGSGKSNFMLKSYDLTSTTATATATYISGYAQYVNRTFLFANGRYLYDISFDYEQGAIDETLPDECASLFREFVSDKVRAEAEAGLTESELYELYKDEDGTAADGESTTRH